VGDQRAPDSLPSDEDLSERAMRQLEGISGEVADKSANLRLCISGKCIGKSKYISYRPLLSDFQLQYATERSEFPSLDSVKLVVFGSTAEAGKVLTSDKASPEVWKQTLPIEV